jgi:hypothetical protein
MGRFANGGAGTDAAVRTVGRRSVAVVLLFLLGWRVFGFVVTGWDSGWKRPPGRRENGR